MVSSQNLRVNEPLFQSLEAFLASKGPNKQHFRINPVRENVIIGNRGTRVTIPAYALISASGQYVNGPAEIELTELFQPTEMILANRPSTSEDRLLELGGQVDVFARQTRVPLHLQRPIQVQLPIWGQPHNPLAMRLFERSTPTMRACSTQVAFDWRLVKGGDVGLERIKAVKYYTFSIPAFNGYHCSSFLHPKKQKVMVSVYPVGRSAFDDQLAFLAFRNRNTVARMHWSGSHFTAFNIPASSSAEVIVLGLKHGQFFMGRNRFRKAKDKTLNVHLRPCSPIDVIDSLQDL